MGKLQKKMITVAFLSTVIVFFIMAFGFYMLMVSYNADQADAVTSLIDFNGGLFPEEKDFSREEFEQKTHYRIRMDDEAAFRMRYFIVQLDDQGKVLEIKSDHISSVTRNEAGDFSKEVMKKNSDTGYYKEYRYRIVREPTHSGIQIIFLDCEDTIDAETDLFQRILVVALFLAVAVTFVFALFSRKIVEPFERNRNMQKQFITDAGHELKTPLAVISANAEVLKYKNGNNEWIDNITSQTERMTKLINRLLMLSRMEEVGEGIDKQPVNMTEIVDNTVSRLKEVFSQKKAALSAETGQDIMAYANRSQMETLCDILIENASKYVNENGRADIRLFSDNRKVALTVSNSSVQAHDMDCSKIFERFYRTDKSRTSSTGGHGIGLSIAKRIVEQHNGTINAAADGDVVTFTVRL